MRRIIGPDVSTYQDEPGTPLGIDFDRMKQVADFVIIRAGQNLWTDPVFKKNWKAAKESELPRGSYWFYDSRADPNRQAALWANQLGDDAGELPLFADFEEAYNGPYKGWQNWQRFLEELKARVGGKEIGIYTAFYYWRDNAPNPKTDANSLEYFHQYPLWIANYGVARPSVPRPWGEDEWLFWQYTETGDGKNYGAESNAIDLNYFNGDAQTFASRFQVPTPEGPAPPLPGTGTMYRVNAVSLNVRVGPDTSYWSLGHLKKGEVVEKISANADGTWIQIRRNSDDLTGWCAARYLVLVGGSPPVPPPGTGILYRVTATSLNVREGPGTSFNSIGHLKRDEVVEKLNVNADGSWIQIRQNGGGLAGWSSARYLVLIKSIPTSPLTKNMGR